MENEIIQRVKKFISDEAGRSEDTMTKETSLEGDLGIYGDDAFELIIAFGREFNVDVSNFMAADYFRGEGGLVLPPVLSKIFKSKKDSVQKELTINHLAKAVIAGRLDEEIINS